MKKVTQLLWVVILIVAGTLPNVAYSQNANELAEVAPMKIKTIPGKNDCNNLAKIIKGNVDTKSIDKSKFSGRIFYGNLIYKGSWNSLSITTVPYGIYSFAIGDNIEETPKMTNLRYSFMAGAYRKGEYYAIRPVSMFGSLTSVFYNTLDVVNYKMVNEKILDTDVNYGMLASTMCYDPISDEIYAVQYNSDLTGLYWTTFDRKELSFEPIVKWRGGFNALCIAAVPDGRILCISDDGGLYSINKTNGVSSYIGATGVSPQSYSQSAFYDGKTGTLIWSTQTSQGSKLYSINITTGEASLIASYTDSEQIIGLYTLDNEAVDGAPAQIKDLKLNFAQPGDLSATIDFTIPTTSYDNNSLSENVNLKVWNSGELLKDESVAPGTHFSIPVQYTNDNQHIAVVLSNKSGYGPYNIIDQYVGYDFPKAVGNLKFALGTDENVGKSIVSWTAPTEGVNNGYIDPNSLYYKIIREPNDVMVADNYKETTFSETLPTDMHKYSYKVIPYNGASKEGVVAYSDTITYGTAFTVPYLNVFDSQASLDLFTILDLNNDGNTWRYNSNELKVSTSYKSDASNDWLITPRIHLNANKVYRFVSNLRTAYSGYKEDVKILLGTDLQDGLKSFTTTIAHWENLEITDDFTDKAAEFTVDKDGDYYIGMGYLTNSKNGTMLRVKNVAVEEIALTGAPDAVSNLTITPDPNDALTAELSFTTPEKAMDGSALTSLKDVKIYRNNEEAEIATINSPAVNSIIKWKDEDVKTVGFNTYTVVAENSVGKGKSNQATAFIGVYTSPYKETFDSKSVMDLYSAKVAGMAEGETYQFEYSKDPGCIGLNHFCQTVPFESWIISPVFKLDGDFVYQLDFSYKNGGYGKPTAKYCTSIKASDATESQASEIGILPGTTNYGFIDQSQEFVLTKDGRYNICWYGQATEKWDFVDYSIDNVSIKKVASAKSPNIVENLSMKADASGALQSTVSFKAPTKDYADRAISTISKIEIYRGESSSIPVKTYNDPKPGDDISWVDAQPIKGNNSYMIVATNEYGRGKVSIDSLFVGTDIPKAIDELKITTDATNQKPILSWSPVTVGKNGGVVVKDQLYYSVIQYDPSKADDKKLTIIASNIKDCTYTIDRANTSTQDIEYYGIVAYTPDGNSDIKLGAINVGGLYTLPYAESFANGVSTSSPWTIDENEDYTSWDATSSMMYNVVAQDGDNGVCYFYNGNYTEFFANAVLISPKFYLNNVDATLSFWLYQGLTCSYKNKPTVQPMISVNDASFTNLGDVITLATGDAGWKEYTYSLSDYKDAKNIRLGFDGYSSGYNDIIYLDNILIKEKGSVDSNIQNNIVVYGTKEGVVIKGALGKKVEIYSYSGQLISDFIAQESELRSILSGIYLIKIDGKTYKVIVK